MLLGQAGADLAKGGIERPGRSAAFYSALGLVLIVHEPPRYARFRCPDSDETLSVEVTGEPRLGARVQLFFECPDLDRTVANLESKGLSFSNPDS
jgi:hypothetical protein